MRIKLIIISIIYCFNTGFAQNCNAYLYAGDTLQYEACQIAEERSGHYQFSWEYQKALERAVAHCPYFSHGYRHMSVAYLKSGDFINWKRLMDQAVALEPLEHLPYRGWCRFQFFKDYQGAIADIERLDSLTSYDIGYSSSGEYHLHIGRGLCYKALGQKEKAIEIIEEQLNVDGYSSGPYDHLHLGILYLETNQYDRAIEQFRMQQENNDLAEGRYYHALALKALNRPYKAQLLKAKEMYLNNRKMFDSYIHQMDMIFLKEIEKALSAAS